MRPVISLAFVALVLHGAAIAGRPVGRSRNRRLEEGMIDSLGSWLDAVSDTIVETVESAADAVYATAEEKAVAVFWAAFEKGAEAVGLDPASARASLEAYQSGELIWGQNCSPDFAADTWDDDLDYCCWVHDNCYGERITADSPGATLPGFMLMYCECDAAMVECADRVQAKCVGREDEAACEEENKDVIAEAAVLRFLFYYIGTTLRAMDNFIDIGTCPDPPERIITDGTRPAPSVCVYCTSEGDRESHIVNGMLDCDWQGATVPLRELPETSCPTELRGMALAAELTGCPDSESASECAAPVVAPTTVCVYCTSDGSRKSYVINGLLDCTWQGQLVSLSQLPESTCPSEVDGMLFATELAGCPDPDSASECAAY